MKQAFSFSFLALFFIELMRCYGQQATTNEAMNNDALTVSCGDNCQQGSLSCKLTSPELQKRKATVIASLKEQILERKELENGYSFKFADTDSILDELTEFVKTERQCCDFFEFGLSVKGNTSSIWLTITGPEGTKEFITAEMEL